MMGQANKQLNLELTNMKRNPYLVNYAQERRIRGSRINQENRINQGNRINHENQINGRTEKSLVRQAPVDRQYPKRKKNARRTGRRRILLLPACMACVAGVLLLLLLQDLYNPVAVGHAAFAETNPETPVSPLPDEKIQGISAADYNKHPAWTENFLTPNEYSRPGDPLNEVTSIFVHYTANKGTSAAQNRSYFEQLKDTQERSASAHFIIGYEGEIIQCVPLDEIAYAVQTRNGDSISIECCYLADDGSFTQETYDSLISLLQWLMETYDLNTEDILRHYDCGGKKCPVYYTEHEDAWEQLKRDVAAF